VAKYQSGDHEAAIANFMELVGGAGWLDGLKRHIPGAFAGAVADADALFEIEIPTLPEFPQRFTRENARRISQPILAAIGAESASIFREIHELVLSMWPGAEAVEIPKAGHALQMENPRAVADALARFFARHQIR
jgi:3-oxoadipate enol-lactonase